MCGILGVLRLDGQRAREAPLRQMARALAHRGPDGVAFWVDGPVGLGLTRLATVGVAEPTAVFVDGRVHSVVNGEVYGHVALARELRVPVPAVDTQLLSRVCHRHGPQGVLRVPGTFAAAFHDGSTLWLARDRVGKKPLFYVVTPRAVWFASEIKALVAGGALAVKADARAVGRFLFQGTLEEEEPLLEGVCVVPPGVALGFAPGRPPQRVDAPPWDLDDGAGAQLDRLRILFDSAVQRRLPTEVAAVTLFSGGLDSTVVAARAGLPLLTIRVPESDETEQATLGARALGLPLTVVDAPRRTRAWLRRALHHLETPDASAAFAMAPAVLRAADELHARGIKVVLGGEGADEVFLGYPWHRVALGLMRQLSLPSDVNTPLARRTMGLLTLSRLTGPPLRPLEAWVRAGTFRDHAAVLFAGQPVTLVSEPMGPVTWSVPVPHAARQRQLDALRRDMLLLPVLHADRLLFAAGVEARLPFLDDALVAHALTAPANALERWDRDKPLLRRLVRGLLPQFRPPPKRGFAAPRSPPPPVLRAWAHQRHREGTRVLDLARMLRSRAAAPEHRHEALWRAFLVEETLDVMESGGPGLGPSSRTPRR